MRSNNSYPAPLNSHPLPSALQFDAAYWHVFDQLETHKTDELRTHPGYFRFLTLIALHVFKTHLFPDGKRLDVVLLEVGMGGRYDPTNVLESADACAVTKLDLDHTRILGDTLEKIAFEKVRRGRRGTANAIHYIPRWLQ